MTAVVDMFPDYWSRAQVIIKQKMLRFFLFFLYKFLFILSFKSKI